MVWARLRDGCGLTAREFRGLTLREITYLHDARDARDAQADWQTARIVAMLAAVNSKREKYQPMKWMAGGKELMRQAQQRAVEKEPPTGDDILAAFQKMGIPVIDRRAKKAG